jgi:hypothetical protein
LLKLNLPIVGGDTRYFVSAGPVTGSVQGRFRIFHHADGGNPFKPA